LYFFFFNDTATTEIYTLSLHDALPISLSSKLPPDPDGVVANLPSKVREQYGGYTEIVYKSFWTNWKPSHPAPYKVGVLWSPLINPAQTAGFKQAQDAAKSVPGVTKVIALATNSGKLTDQIQQYSSLVRQKVDVIIAEPLAPGPFIPQITAAAKAGIPTIVTGGAEVSTKYAVNIQDNVYRQSQALASRLVQAMGGKGGVLMVRGVAGFPEDTVSAKAYTDMFKSCSGVKILGQVVGAYSPSVAKSEVLKFLATHPGKVDGVAQAGTMGPGIVSGFSQAGRPVPPVMEQIPSGGFFVYWKNHQPDFKGVAIGYPQRQPVIATTLARMLKGNGPKISMIMLPTIAADAGNLGTFIKPGWTEGSDDVAVVPESLVPPSSAYDAYFAKGHAGVPGGM